MINLRLKGNSIYWTEDNAEAVFQLRAAVVSGRWEEIVEHTREGDGEGPPQSLALDTTGMSCRVESARRAG